MRKKLVKIGNSLSIILPMNEMNQLNLKAGDMVEIISNGEEIRIVPVNRIRPIRLGGLWKGLTISEEEIQQTRHEFSREPFS